MAHFDLNVLHLHLTDAAGWRVEIGKYPRLTEIGAWRSRELWKDWWFGDRAYGGPYGGYYTQDELRDLVAYAAERGVTIVPEIEFPGHSEEVVAAYPHLGFNHAEMDLDNDSVYVFMRDVLTEVAGIFSSPYLHVGGDEVATQKDKQQEAMFRVQEIVNGLGRHMVVWDDILSYGDKADSLDAVIMVWRNLSWAREAMERGQQVVLCLGRWLYFDRAQDAPVTQPDNAGGYLPMDSVYALPLADLLSCGDGVLGIQCNVWREYIPTVEHTEYMLWPRAVAVSRLAHGLGADRDAELKATGWLRDSLHINAFDLSREVGQRSDRSVVVNSLSTGKLVRYLHPYHPYYPAAGDASLTDGLQGGWDNTDGRWQGFIGSQGMDVVVDLGESTHINKVDVTFLQSCGPEIFLPATFVLSASDDGIGFEPFHRMTDIEDVRQFACETLEWSGTLETRYIRVQAMPGPRQGWVFADEIKVW